MPLEQLERLQIISGSLAEVWSFFGRPENLADITPAWLAADGARFPSLPACGSLPGASRAAGAT